MNDLLTECTSTSEGLPKENPVLRLENVLPENTPTSEVLPEGNPVSGEENILPKNPSTLEEPPKKNLALGLENIPIIDCEATDGSEIEFTYSTPKKICDLPPNLQRWSPKIHDVVSIVEETIDTTIDHDHESNDDGDDTTNTDKSDEDLVNDNVVYINEDAVKQEEFADENSEENFDSEMIKNSKNNNDELNISFDEHKVKQEFNITDNLCIKLDKITNFNLTSYTNLHNSLPKRSTRAEKSRQSRLSISPTKENEVQAKLSHVKKSSKNLPCVKNSQRSRRTNSDDVTRQNGHQKKKPPSNLSKQVPTNLNPVNKNKRQSLRLSGKSPEIKFSEEVSFTTRSGKKRIYEEPKSKPVNGQLSRSSAKDSAVSNLICGNMNREPENEVKTRLRSVSPSAFRKHIDYMYVCQCCDQKYLLLEQIKAHVRTHFPNVATN